MREKYITVTVATGLTALLMGLYFAARYNSRPELPFPVSNDSSNRAAHNLAASVASALPKKSPVTVRVVRVIDGDTIELAGGERVRYIGINTPESVDPRRPVQCFAQEASVRNKTLVENKQIRLEKDISSTDRYGRLLRYVFVSDKDNAEIFVNAELVKEGYALASAYPPDVTYQHIFEENERSARAANRGLWRACPSLPVPAPVPPTPAFVFDGKCAIKGNLSAAGEKIYHLSDCPHYAQTKIDPARGERWFCTVEEARAAGWRQAHNCP